MRLIVAFLFGLLAICNAADTADDNGEVLEWDSNEETGSTQSYNGIVIRVYQNDNGSPTITLGSEQDDHKDIYCLKFKGLFESQDYDDTISEDATFTKIAGTEMDLADADCTTNESSDTQFTISCNNVDDVDGATLTLTFTFNKDEQGDHGVEYVISFKDYTFTGDSHARLVMVQSLIECSSQYPYDDGNDSDNNDDEEDDDMDTTESPDINDINDNDDDTTTESPAGDRRRRRRLLDDDTDTDGGDDSDIESVDDDDVDDDVDDDGNEIDSDSEDEEDGISSDDSNEFDAGTARFVMSGQAFDRCDDPADDRMIESKLVYQSDSDELHIVFHHFDCELSMDPFVGLDDSKYQNDDKTASMQITIAFIMSVIIMSLL